MEGGYSATKRRRKNRNVEYGGNEDAESMIAVRRG
jgi:hypothetical protein